MPSVIEAHLAVEKAAAKYLPYSFFYHVRNGKVTGITVGVTPAQYKKLNIDDYADIAAKLKVPFNIIERKAGDQLLNDTVFGETFDIGKTESDIYEDIRFSELVNEVIVGKAGGDVDTYALGNVDDVFADYLDAERLPSKRHDFEGYAVIDYETTGFNPDKGDRGIEIAIVHIDPTGAYENHWDTLVSADGVDAGATHIHKITNEMLVKAPPISEVSLAFGALLQNRKVLSHNKKFDHPFLANEFKLGGLDSPVSYDDMLCSLIWSRDVDRYEKSHKLIDAAARAGIKLDGAHEAIYDTMATANLVSVFLKKHGDSYPLTGAPVAPSFMYEGGLAQVDNFVSRAKESMIKRF
jgi:DNA polymerase III epsilon subunit-like protein